MSFLDGMKLKPRVAVCHDSNHNGDDKADGGCGNPSCWKHDENSPPSKKIVIPWCSCPFCEESRKPGFFKSRGVDTSDVCPNCGESEQLAKIKGCIRCLKCGWKQDCNGW